MEEQIVWKCTVGNESCHFGDRATAKAWGRGLGVIEEIRIKGKARTTTPLRAVQNWSGMQGAIAFSIIERQADDWTEAGKMMEEWLTANGGTVPNA